MVDFSRAFFFEDFEVSEHFSHGNCFLGRCISKLVAALGHNPRRAEFLPFVFEGKRYQGKLLGQMIWTREIDFESARTQMECGWPCLAPYGALSGINPNLNAPVLQALAAFQQGSSQLLFAEPCPLKFFRMEQGLKAGDELVAGEHEGASAAAAELVGAELGHEFVGLTPLNLEDLFDDEAINDRRGKTPDLGDNVGQAVKPGELWRQGRTSAATTREGYVLGEPSLRSVGRDSFSRNCSEDVSARSGSITREVTSYNVRYGVLPCFGTFSTILFRMPLNPGKPPWSPQNLRENPEIVVVDVSWLDRFLASASVCGPLSAPFGDPRGGDINDDELNDVQPYPVELCPESRRRAEGISPLSRRGPLGD